MIADNAKSLAVFHNVKINTTGRFNSKPCKIISENEYMQGFDYLNQLSCLLSTTLTQYFSVFIIFLLSLQMINKYT